MYLKGIVTSGFKSFADKLELKLDGKIIENESKFLFSKDQFEVVEWGKVLDSE